MRRQFPSQQSALDSRRAQGRIRGMSRDAELEQLVLEVWYALSQQLKQTDKKLMSKLTDWAEQEEVKLDGISADLDAIKTGVDALDAAIVTLQKQLGNGLTAAE